jgi:putative hemolysin
MLIENFTQSDPMPLMSYQQLHSSFVFFISILLSTCVYAMPNPAATLCAQLHYKIKGDACVFPDESSCDQWAFWRGTCGQSYHLCTHSQGQLTEKDNDLVCVIAGKDYHWTLRKMDNKEQLWKVVLTPDESTTTNQDRSPS